MVWRRIGDKPLSESVLTRFTDAYMRYKGEWINSVTMGIEGKYLTLYSWRRHGMDKISASLQLCEGNTLNNVL